MLVFYRKNVGHDFHSTFLFSHGICWNIWLIWIECRFIVSIDNLHWFELQMKTQRKAWFVDIHAHTYTIVSILICILSFFKEIVNGIENCIFSDWIIKRCLPISEMPIKNKQKRIIMHDNQKKKLHNFYHFCFIRSNILKKWKNVLVPSVWQLKILSSLFSVFNHSNIFNYQIFTFFIFVFPLL